MNRDNSDKLCWHLVEMEKLSPPPRHPWKDHMIMASLGRATMRAQKEKGMQTQAYMNGATMSYSFLAHKCSPPLMHPRGSIYSPSIGNEGGKFWRARKL